MKTLWEKCDRYQVKVKIGNINIEPPRDGDKWLIQAFSDEGYKDDELRRLNRVRIHQQTLFLSDVLNANGRSIDLKYTEERLGIPWSSYTFPIEHPLEADFELWRAAIYSVSPASRPQLRVREFKTHGHKIWDWRYLEEEEKLLYWSPLTGLRLNYGRTEGALLARRPDLLILRKACAQISPYTVISCSCSPNLTLMCT